MTNYKMKLQDPRWIEKSKQIKKRDKYKCVCGNPHKLQVHHKEYRKGKEPWDYDDDDLITLCDECHETNHKAIELGFDEDEVNDVFETKQQIKSGDWDKLSERV